MSGHDITPSPPGAHPILERLFEGMRTTGLLPPKAPAAPLTREQEAREVLERG